MRNRNSKRAGSHHLREHNRVEFRKQFKFEIVHPNGRLIDFILKIYICINIHFLIIQRFLVLVHTYHCACIDVHMIIERVSGPSLKSFSVNVRYSAFLVEKLLNM